MPTPLYECMHVPVKGATLAVKHPIPAGVAAVAVIAVYLRYGIWPFVFLVVVAICAMVGFGWMIRQNQASPRATASVTNIHARSGQPTCIRHPQAIAANIYRFHLPSGETRDVPICGPCIPEFTAWLDQKQLTTGY